MKHARTGEGLATAARGLAGLIIGAFALAGSAGHSTCTAAEVEPFLRNGSAAIEGTAILKIKRQPHVAARRTIEIFPRTPCFDAWWAQPASHTFAESVLVDRYPKDDPIFRSSVRKISTDAEGRFAAYGLPAGRYRLRIPWVDESPGSYTVILQRQYFFADVVLTSDRTTQVKKFKP